MPNLSTSAARRVVATLTALLVVVGLQTVSASAAGDLGISVQRWLVNTSTGSVDYSVRLSGTSPCPNEYCTAAVSTFYKSGTAAAIEVGSLSGSSLSPGTTQVSIDWTAVRTLPETTDLRLRVTNGAGVVLQEQWLHVQEPYPAMAVTIDVANWVPNQRTGEAEADVTVRATGLGGYGRPCAGTYCNLYLLGGTYDGTGAFVNATQVTSASYNGYGGTWTLTPTVRGKIQTGGEVTHLRAKFQGSDKVYGEQRVAANFPDALLDVTVHDWGPGRHDISVRGGGLRGLNEPCVSDCYYGVQGWQENSDGTKTAVEEYLNGLAFPTWTFESRLTSTTRDPRVNLIRIYAGPYASQVTRERWVRMGGGQIRHDNDISEQAGLLAGYVAAGLMLDPCIEAFPTGPRTNGSSLNDYQALCEQARALGQPWKEAFRRGAAAATAGTLVRANVAAHARWLTSSGGGKAPHPTGRTWNPGDRAPLDAFVMSQGVERLLQRVRASSPDFDVTQDKRRLAWAVYRKCLDVAPIDECNTLPLFSPGQDVNEAALHVREATNRTPSWYRQQYVSNSERLGDGVSRSWYASDAVCKASTTAADGNECDEFPFFSTELGGPATSSKPKPSLKRLLAAHNAKEGRQLSAFYRACGFPAKPRYSPDRQFLVLPLPDSGLNTSAWCSRFE